MRAMNPLSCTFANRTPAASRSDMRYEIVAWDHQAWCWGYRGAACPLLSAQRTGTTCVHFLKDTPSLEITTDASLELQALLDAAVDGIMVIDHLGKVLTFNRAAERIFGYEAGDVIGSSVDLLMSDEERRSFYPVFFFLLLLL